MDLSLKIILRGQDGGIGGLISRVRGNLATMEREDAGRHRRILSRLNGLANGYRRIGSAIRGATVLAAGFAGTVIGAGIVGITRTAVAFERYEAVLTGLEGSQVKARASMRWVQEFAASTPYEIDQVMEAFVRLRAYGIDPTDGTLRALGDTASTMGKDLMAAVEMLADAQSGEFERLKEFGIRAAQAGDQVTFSWVQNGETMTRSSKKAGAEITRTLLDILGPRNMGAMERQSKTLGGLWSGLMDRITLFKLDIANAGLGAFMKAELDTLLGNLDTPGGKLRAQTLAREISSALIDGIKTIREAFAGVDVSDFIGALVSIVTFIPKVINFFDGFSGLITTLGGLGIAKIGLDIGILGATIAGIAGVAAAPIIGVVAAVTAVALAAWLIIRNWSSISKFFGQLMTMVVAKVRFGLSVLVKAFLRFHPLGLIFRHWSTVVAFFEQMWPGVVAAFRSGIQAVWNILPPWFRQILRGGSIVIRAISGIGSQPPPGGSGGGGGRPPAPPPGGASYMPPASRPGANRVTGAIDVRVYQDGRPPQVSARSADLDFGVASMGGVQMRGGG